MTINDGKAEMAERIQGISKRTGISVATIELVQTLRNLVFCLKEAHQDEIDKKHYGDDNPEVNCSYCREIHDAEETLQKHDPDGKIFATI